MIFREKAAKSSLFQLFQGPSWAYIGLTHRAIGPIPGPYPGQTGQNDGKKWEIIGFQGQNDGFYNKFTTFQPFFRGFHKNSTTFRDLTYARIKIFFITCDRSRVFLYWGLGY